MRFLVFSDSHGALYGMYDLVQRNIGHADGIFFLGDGYRDFTRLREKFPEFAYCGVTGNCDTFLDTAGEAVNTLEVLSFEGHRLLLTHGHRQSCKYGDGGLLRAAEERGCDVILHGHTHSTRSERLTDANGREILVCNPGTARLGQYGVLEFCGGKAVFSLHCTDCDVFE